MTKARLSRLQPEYQEAKTHIYCLSSRLGLTAKEQHDLINAMDEREGELIREQTDGKTIIIELMGIILDGLKFGNWPWSGKTIGGV